MTAQEELIHYYLKIDGNDPSEYDIEYGIVAYEEGYAPEQVPDASISDDAAFVDRICASMADSLAVDELNVMIHGIWGDFIFAWKEMVRNLSRDVYSERDGKKRVLVSIIWDSSINYLTGVKIARQKGEFLGPMLAELVGCQSEETKITFLCHSMGNRIFQHMIMGSGLMGAGDQKIDHYISAGADVESNIFEKDQPLADLHKVVGMTTIYMHNNDRSLKMSKLINKNKRLGLNGLDLTKVADNFRIIDVSVITDHVNFSSSMSNHRYFYMSPTVIQDIRRMVWGGDFTRNKRKLDHARRWKLLPDEEVTP